MLRRSQRKQRQTATPEEALSPTVESEWSHVMWYKTRQGNDAFTARSIRFPGTMFRYVSSQGNRHNNQVTRRFVCVSCCKINNVRCSSGQRSIPVSGVSIRNGEWLDDPDYPYWEHICINPLHTVDWPAKNARHFTNYKLPEVDAAEMLSLSHEGLTVLDELKQVNGDVHGLTTVSYRHLIRVLCADLFESSGRQNPPPHQKRGYMQAFFNSIEAKYDAKDQRAMQSVNMRIRRLMSKSMNGENEESSVHDEEDQFSANGERKWNLEGDSASSSGLEFIIDQFPESIDSEWFNESWHPEQKKMKTEPGAGNVESGVMLQFPNVEDLSEDVNEASFAETPMQDELLLMEDTNFLFAEPFEYPAQSLEASDQFERDIEAAEISSRFLAMGLRPPNSLPFEHIWENTVVDKLISFGQTQMCAVKGIERFLQVKNATDVKYLSFNDRSELAFRLLPVALFGNDHAYFSKHLTKVFIDCHATMRTLQDPRHFYTDDSMNHPVIVRMNNRYAVVFARKLITVDGGFASALRLLVEVYLVLGEEVPFEVYLPVRFLQYIYDVDRQKMTDEHKSKFEMIITC